MMLEIFAIFGIWIAFAIAFGIVLFFQESESPGFAGFTLLIAIGVFQWIFGVDVLGYIWAYPMHVVLGIIGYLVIGAPLTGFGRWREYCKKNKNPKEFTDYQAKYPGNTFEDYVKSAKHFTLHPTNNYYRLFNWWLFWPTWVFWDLLHKPITFVWRVIYDLFGGLFLKIAAAAVK